MKGCDRGSRRKFIIFPDADREDIFKGKGPSYSVKEISKSSKKPYWRASLDSFRLHETQAKGFVDQLKKMDDAQIEKMMEADGWASDQTFVLGKSLVGGATTDPIFSGIESGAIPFGRAAFSVEAPKGDVAVTLAGPWSFYDEFRAAHQLTHLPHPEPPEIALQEGTTLIVPLWVRNATAEARELTISAELPSGWKVSSGAGKVKVGANQTAGTRVEITLGALKDAAKGKDAAQAVTVKAESGGKSVGEIVMKVELRKKALPE